MEKSWGIAGAEFVCRLHKYSSPNGETQLLLFGSVFSCALPFTSRSAVSVLLSSVLILACSKRLCLIP